MTLRTKLRAWLDASVGNRLMLASVAAVAVAVLSLGGTAFPLFYYQAWTAYQTHSRNHLDRIADSFEFRLDSAQQNLAQLAKNSFVVNSFVDSTGRDAYLRPTLREFNLPFPGGTKLVLYDANLSPFAGNTPEYAALGDARRNLAGEVLAQGKARIAVSGAGGGTTVIFAFPIYYPPASAHEGVLLALPPRQNSCRSDKIRNPGGDKDVRWLDMDRYSRTGRWRGCCRRRVLRWLT